MNTAKGTNKSQAYESMRNFMKSIWDIPDELIKELFCLCRFAQVKKGQQFIKAGDIPEYMGFNLNGIFRLYYIDPNGNDLTKGFSTEGKFVASYSALAENRPSFFSIEAMVDTDILQFKYSQWMKMVEKDIRWYPFLFKLVESVYIMKEMREKSFLLDDAASRYLAFKASYPDLENKIRQYHIASFIGITPEALSRIRKKYKIDIDQ